MTLERRVVRAVMRNPIRAIVTAFILTVGITPPTPKQERVATIFVSALLIGTVVLALAVFAVLMRRIT